MSKKKNIGSSLDDFLKEEGIFRGDPNTGNQGSCRMAARRGYEKKTHLAQAYGHAPENKQDASQSATRSKIGYYVVELAARCTSCWPQSSR